MDYIFFDLDGTLVDTREGILVSMEKALEEMGVTDSNAYSAKQLIGPPLKTLFMEHFGLDEDAAQEATKVFRKFYNDSGKFCCCKYSGIEETLKCLKNEGYVLAVATSKPTVFAEDILKHLGLDKYFDQIVGSNLDNTRGKKQEVIQYLLDEYQIKATDNVYMIGDKAQDLIGAAACNVSGIGVTYGFGTREELETQQHQAILSSPATIAEYFKYTLRSGQ